MLSEDLKNLSSAFGQYADTGIEISGEGILEILGVIDAAVAQARALELSVAPEPFSRRAVCDGVVDFTAIKAKRDIDAWLRSQGLKAADGGTGENPDPDPKGAA